jgi:hypothetical protein
MSKCRCKKCENVLANTPAKKILCIFESKFIDQLYMNNIFLEFENHNLVSRLLRVMPLEKQLRSVKMFFLAHYQNRSSTDSNKIYSPATIY